MRIFKFILGGLFVYLLIYLFLCMVGAYAIEQAERRMYRD